MLRITALVLLGLLFPFQNLPADERVDMLREQAGKFPLLEMVKGAVPYAEVYKLPKDNLHEWEGAHFTGFRVKMPEWLDGWFVMMDGYVAEAERLTHTLPRGIISLEDDSMDEWLRGASYPVDHRFPACIEHMPGCKVFTFGNASPQLLIPGKTYLIWFAYREPNPPDHFLAMTVRSDNGLQQFGMLPTGPPEIGYRAATSVTTAPPKSPDLSIDEAIEIKNRSGTEAALAHLDYELAEYLKTVAPFSEFRLSLWEDAQHLEGHRDMAWAAAEFFWLENKCIEYGAMVLAEEVSVNASISMFAQKRFGAARLALYPFFQRSGRRAIDLDPRSMESTGPALMGLPWIQRRAFSTEANRPITVVDFDGTLRNDRELPNSFGYNLSTLASLEVISGGWETALERWVWASDLILAVKPSNSNPITESFRIRMFIADTLRKLDYLEAADSEYVDMVLSELPDPENGRFKTLAKLKRIDVGIGLGPVRSTMLKEIDLIENELNNNSSTQEEDHAEVRLIRAKCLNALGQTDDAEAILKNASEPLNSGERKLLALIHLKQGTTTLDEMHGLLDAFREEGAPKIEEADVYSIFADYLQGEGHLSEAQEIRNEAIRLHRSFNLPLALPKELAKQAVLLDFLGKHEEAEACADEAIEWVADSKKIPARVAKQVKEVLSDRGTATGKTIAEADRKVDIATSPYRSNSVRYSYQQSESTSDVVHLRAVASESVRVELYQGDGTPVSVDAQGDGDFEGVGDCLFQADVKGFPEIQLEDGEASIDLKVFPVIENVKGDLSLKIQEWTGKDWSDVSILEVPFGN